MRYSGRKSKYDYSEEILSTTTLLEVLSGEFIVPKEFRGRVWPTGPDNRCKRKLGVSMGTVRIDFLDNPPDELGRVCGPMKILKQHILPHMRGKTSYIKFILEVYPNSTEQAPPIEVRVWNGQDTPPFPFTQRFGPDLQNGNIFLNSPPSS